MTGTELQEIDNYQWPGTISGSSAETSSLGAAPEFL
jgi:hypothetical protein